MSRIFVSPEQLDLDARTAHIIGQDHLHLARVLRARIGQQITLLDGLGGAYLATLTKIDKRDSTAHIEKTVEPPPEPRLFITVAQAIGKSDKFEQVIQHGAEVGAGRFLPVQAERSVVDIPASRMAERIARWKAIAKGAAEQSFRARIPEIGNPVKLAEVVRAAAEAKIPALLLHTAPPSIPLFMALRQMETLPQQIILLVGPEGGWSANELELANGHGCQPISLGPHVLRTETAALVAIGQLLYHFSAQEEFTSCVS